jgi:predicted ATPase
MSTILSAPRIEGLKIKNYRALKHLELNGLSPLSVFLGPNASGKSTIFDVFAFLSQCFFESLRKAWDKRGKFKELRSRNATGPIEIEIKYRERPRTPIITYHLSIDENIRGPVVTEEWLKWRIGKRGQPFHFLRFNNGSGWVIRGDMPEEKDDRIQEELDAPDKLAVNTLGQFKKHPRVSALRQFITGWYLSYLTIDSTKKANPEAGAQDHLTQTGDNLSNVIQFYKEEHSDTLDKIFTILSQRVPKLEKVDTEVMADGRLLLKIKDRPFDDPILSKFASDGTIKMLAYLVLLYDPIPFPFVGIEEPENHLHPRLLPELAEECKMRSDVTQIMISSHSPYFIDSLQPKEVWVLDRDKNGYTIAKRASDMPGIKELIESGFSLGQLWMENYFEIGDPKAHLTQR